MVISTNDALGPERELTAAARNLTTLVCHGVPGCDGASLSLLRDGDPFTLASSEHFAEALDAAQYERDSGPCLTAMRDAVDVAVEDFGTETRWRHLADDVIAAGVRSSLSLPLHQGGRVIGGLNLYGRDVAAFNSASRAAASAFAAQAELMLGYLGRLQAERAAHAQERHASTTLQRSLLPVLPEIPGLTTAARYLVSSQEAQVGGDWYDVFALPDGAVGVAVGDVMGHDIAAAAAMGQLRSVLRSYAYEGSSPSVVLARLDRLVQDFEMAQLATAIYGRLVLDADGAMLLFTNAGHLPPFLVGPDGDVKPLRRGSAALIGVAPPEQTLRGEGAVLIPAGSLLVLFTDGLIETRQRDVDEGLARLSEVLTALPKGIEPEQACDAVLEQMLREEQQDDVVLLILRIDGAAAG